LNNSIRQEVHHAGQESETSARQAKHIHHAVLFPQTTNGWYWGIEMVLPIVGKPTELSAPMLQIASQTRRRQSYYPLKTQLDIYASFD
jgi:hypothetical protein